jgi:hypothetical protein
MIAPNGKQSNLTDSQYKLVRTPAFKEWFGDWENNPSEASKVVDSNGEPLIVYHGTDAIFNEFKKQKKGWETFWFTPNFDTAKMYSLDNFKKETDKNNSRVLQCFLNVRNPNNKYPFDIIKYDGFIDYKTYMDYDIWKQIKTIQVIQVVSSNQIKLADGSNTTFDSNNNDIRFDGGGQVDEYAQQLIDIISMNPQLEKYQKYKVILKDKFGINFDDFYKDDYYIENANLLEIKVKDDFINYDKYIEYSKKIFRLRGLINDYYSQNIEGVISIEKAIEIGKKLKFIVKQREYDGGSGNYAEHSIDTITIPNKVDINSFIHEIGHHYDHFESKEYNGLAKTSTYASSLYEIGKSDEVFAENFKNYFIAPNWLKEKLPMVYNELDKNINDVYKKEIYKLIYSSKEKYKQGGNVNELVEDVSTEYLNSIRNQDKSRWNYDLEKSIEKQGILEPVTIGYWSEYDKVTLVDGHHRLDTAIDLDIKSIPTIIQLYYNNPTGLHKLYQAPKYNPNAKKPSDLGIFKKGGLIAPNGKQSNLTESQYKLVRTPAFKNWFGDWENNPSQASKVVDENGEPLVLYHGTTSIFNEFKVGRTNGLFFTNKKESANRFSSGDLKRVGDSPRILECFLKINKLYDKNTNDEILVNNYYQDFFEKRPYIKKQSQKNILKDKFNKFFMDLVSFGIINDEPKLFLLKYNYNGIVINSDNNAKSYITFNSNQIKLADGTNTTFNSNNNDIRFDGGGITQSKDLSKIYNFKNIYKGAEFYSYSDDSEKQEKADRWFELFIKNQKEEIITPEEFKEFISLSNELSLEDLGENNNDIRYKKGGMTNKGYVSYKDKYNTKYGYSKNESHDLKEISKDTGVSMKGLQQIYNKGIGAYKTNPSSVRPNVKSKEQWAMARVYSSVMGGKASKIDSNELKMEKGGILQDKNSIRKYAENLLKDFDYKFIGFSESNYGQSMYFDVDGIKCRFSNHSVTNRDRMINEILFDINNVNSENTKFGNNQSLLQLRYRLGDTSIKYGKITYLGRSGKYYDAFGYTDSNEIKMEQGGNINIKYNNMSKHKDGLFVGKSHKEGGIPMVVKSTGQKIEVEGGESITNKTSMADDKIRTLTGTNCEIISQINTQNGNGVAMDCDSVVGKKYKYKAGGSIQKMTSAQGKMEKHTQRVLALRKNKAEQESKVENNLEDLIDKRIVGLKIALKFASNEEKKLIQKRIKAFEIAKKMLIPNTKTLEDLLEEDMDLQSEIDIEKRKPKNEQSELTRLGLERGVILKKIDEIEKLNTNNVLDIKSMELYVSPMRERNLDKYGEDTNQCISCGKLMKDSDRKYVCMGTDWEAYNTNESEERDGIDYFVGTDTEIQGFFPIGNDCAKKMKGFTFERDNKFNTGGRVYNFSDYSNDALSDMIINLSRYENNEEYIEIVKDELKKRKRKNIGINKKMATGGSISDINKIITQVLQAISENKKIIIGRLIFTSYFNNSSKKMQYRMNDDYRVDKWEEYKNEKEYTKAVMQRVNYYIKKGYPQLIEIN